MPAWSMAKFSTDRQLTALVCVVTVLFCHVSCVIINVTRKSQDIFTNPISGTHPNCLDSGRVAACHQRNAKPDEPHDGVCICKCSYPSSTFLESRLRCVGNSEMRNKSGDSAHWTFLLSDEIDNSQPVGVINLTSNKSIINFKINGINVSNCSPYEVEITNVNGKWAQITNQLSNMSLVLYKNYTGKLSLMWNDNVSSPNPFGGKIMRIHMRCKDSQQIVDDYLIFKVNGTFQVEFFETSSVSPTSSTPSLTSQHSKLSSSFLLVSSAYISKVQMETASYSSPMMAASKERTHFLVTSSAASETMAKFSISPTTLYSSSVIPSGPEKQSNGPFTTEVVIGVVVGVTFAIIIAIIIVYILWKRKWRQGGHRDPGKGNIGNITDKNVGNFPLPALSNPVFQEGAYENPEDVHKDKNNRSGIRSIGSVLYDKCLIVENPSARNGVVSVYDNVHQKKTEQEPAYKSLNQAERESPSPYQSLIKPANEFSAESNGLHSSFSQEPVYSEIDDEPRSTTITTSDDQPKASSVIEPAYNILESGKPNLANSEQDPVYNNLAQSNESYGKREQACIGK